MELETGKEPLPQVLKPQLSEPACRRPTVCPAFLGLPQRTGPDRGDSHRVEDLTFAAGGEVALSAGGRGILLSPGSPTQ